MCEGMEKAKKGYQAIGRTYKNHIDGYNLLPYLTGEKKQSPREFFMQVKLAPARTFSAAA